jgi:hypothetical protein
MSVSRRWAAWAAWACAWMAASALVQAAPVNRPDPLDPRARVPAPRPPEALRRYRPATTPEVGSWREANDTVARVGGWKAYLREAQQPESAASAASAAAPAPVSAPIREHRHAPR